MSAPLVLGIDQGTSSTKCLLVDGSGAVVAQGQAGLAEQFPEPGWVEQDASELWASVRQAVAACVTPSLARSVVAVGLSTQRESCVAWDATSGEPLSPVLSWQDRRTSPLAREIGTQVAQDRVRALSGLPLDPMFSALKARWILDRIDPDRARSRCGTIRLGTIDSFLLSRFGGSPVVEAGNASRTQLLDIDMGRWSSELLDLFGVPVEALPEVVTSTGPFPAVRGLPPLPDGVPVHAVLADSHAALFGHGAHQPGDIKATQGTGSSVMGLLRPGAALDPGLCKTIAWSIGGLVHAAEGNIRAAGSTLRWVAGLMGTSLDELAALAQDASAEGVCLVPGFNGLGAPWWDERAVGVLSHFTLGTSRAAIARAAFDSIAHQIADVVERVAPGQVGAGPLYVDGGPTRNDTLMQSEADLLGRPVWRSRTAELSALGVVHLAGLGAGVWTRDDLARRRADPDVFRPAMTPTERRVARERWRDAVRRSRSTVDPQAGAAEAA